MNIDIHTLLDIARLGATEAYQKHGRSVEYEEAMVSVRFLCDVANTVQYIEDGQNLTRVVKNSRLSLEQITRFLW